MEDIGLSIYTKFTRLKSNVEVHYNFSLFYDQNVYYREVFDIECEYKGSSLRRYEWFLEKD